MVFVKEPFKTLVLTVTVKVKSETIVGETISKKNYSKLRKEKVISLTFDAICNILYTPCKLQKTLKTII